MDCSGLILRGSGRTSTATVDDISSVDDIDEVFHDDGLLTATELAHFDLHGTQLAVLSACETGLGDTPPHQGVYGLRRALILAGSQTQVLSLWQVDAEENPDMMVAYYKRLLAGEGRSDAMRSVQLDMLRNEATSHPYYWASFVVSGVTAPLHDVKAAPTHHPSGCGSCTGNHVHRIDAHGTALMTLLIGVVLFLRTRRARRAGRFENTRCRE